MPAPARSWRGGCKRRMSASTGVAKDWDGRPPKCLLAHLEQKLLTANHPYLDLYQTSIQTNRQCAQTLGAPLYACSRLLKIGPVHVPSCFTILLAPSASAVSSQAQSPCPPPTHPKQVSSPLPALARPESRLRRLHTVPNPMSYG